MSTTPKIALVAGGSGLVGSFLIHALIEAPDYSRIWAVTRRPLGGREHPKLANRTVVFARMADQLKGLAAQEAFCCIGTTRAAAGSDEAFREADLDAVLYFAQAAKAAGVNRFSVVSSVGAKPDSKKLYLRTKGEMEDALTLVGFQSLDIFQPSLLLGPRKEMRPLELAGRLLAPLVNPLLTGAREPFRAIEARTVARGMIGAARRGGRGVYRHTYAAIQQLAEYKSNQPPPVQPVKKPPA